MTGHVINEDRKVPPFTFLKISYMSRTNLRVNQTFILSAVFFFQERSKFETKDNVLLATSRRMGDFKVLHLFKTPLYMSVFMMYELQLEKLALMDRFQNSTEDILKDAFLCVLAKLEDGKAIWKKDILYIIYRYFQITHPIIKNKSA